MKKFLTILLMFLFITAFTSCNYQLFDTNYTFTNAYVKIGEEWIDVEIKSWTDYEGEQIQITLLDGTVMVVNSNNCIPYSGELPKGE